MDYRFFSVETDVIPHANGSAKLQLDDTEILVGVNLEIETPDPRTPNQGRIVCSAECTTSASQDFEGMGARNLNVQLTNELERMLIGSKGIKLEDLCIIPGQECWALYVDAMVMDSAGNLTDAVIMAAKAALSTTVIPGVKIGKDEKGQMRSEVSDDPVDAKALPQDNVPICVSLTKVGPCFVVDPTMEEETCMSSRVSVYVNAKGEFCGLHKSGPGGIAPEALIEMTKTAKKEGVELLTKLDKLIQAQEEGVAIEEDE